MDTVKIHGMPRVGMNWLEWMITQNYDCRVPRSDVNAPTGWKHRLPASDYRGDVIFMCKHPAAWCLSYKKRRSNMKWGDTAARMKTWNTRNRMFLDWHTENATRSLWIPYEHLLEFPIANLSLCQSAFGWYQVRPTLVTNANEMGASGVPKIRKRFDPSFYLEEKYWDHLPSHVLEQVLEFTDWDLADEIGQYEQQRWASSARSS